MGGGSSITASDLHKLLLSRHPSLFIRLRTVDLRSVGRNRRLNPTRTAAARTGIIEFYKRVKFRKHAACGGYQSIQVAFEDHNHVAWVYRHYGYNLICS